MRTGIPGAKLHSAYSHRLLGCSPMCSCVLHALHNTRGSAVGEIEMFNDLGGRPLRAGARKEILRPHPRGRLDQGVVNLFDLKMHALPF